MLRRILAVTAIAAVLSLPVAAQEQPPPAPAVDVITVAPTPPPSPFADLAAKFLTPGGVATVIGAIVSLIGGFVAFSANLKRRVALGAYHAFHVVEDIAAETDTPIDNKAVPYLEAFNAYFLANGWRTPKPHEVQQALLLAKSLNGEAKEKEKIAANAQLSVAKQLSANPQ